MIEPNSFFLCSTMTGKSFEMSMAVGTQGLLHLPSVLRNLFEITAFSFLVKKVIGKFLKN